MTCGPVQFTFQLPVIEDSPPLFKNFGDVDQDVKPSYPRGATAKVSFWGGNPRNNYMTQSNGFLTVERFDGKRPHAQNSTLKSNKKKQAATGRCFTTTATGKRRCTGSACG